MKNFLKGVAAFLMCSLSFVALSCSDKDDNNDSTMYDVQVKLDLVEMDIVDENLNEIEDDVLTMEFKQLENVKLTITCPSNSNFKTIETEMTEPTFSTKLLKGNYIFKVEANVIDDNSCKIVGTETEDIEGNEVVDIDLDKMLLSK